MSTQTQPAAPGDEPTAVAPAGHAVNPAEARAIISEFFRPSGVDPEGSRAIISEFFRAGDKDYAPKDFIQAVREQAREAKADTVAAMGAGADEPETELAPTRAAAERVGLAWSADDDATPLEWPADDDEELHIETALYGDAKKPEPERLPWGKAWSAAAVILLCLVVTAAIVGIVGWLAFRHSDDSTTMPTQEAPSMPATAPSPSGPDDQVVPSTSTPAPTASAAPEPPAATVTPEQTPAPVAPPATVAPQQRPSTPALDEQFLADLTRAGMRVADVPMAIYGAHDTCAYLAAGHTAMEAVEQGMRNNASMTRLNEIAYVDAAIAIYCPQYGG